MTFVLSAVPQPPTTSGAAQFEAPVVVEDPLRPALCASTCSLLMPGADSEPYTIVAIDPSGNRSTIENRCSNATGAGGARNAGDDIGRQRADKPAGEVDEMTALSQEPAAAVVGIVQPMIGRQLPGGDPIDELDRMTTTHHVLGASRWPAAQSVG